MKTSDIRFADRADAGRQLAARLLPMGLDRPVVYALPRGGVPVAREVARVLQAPLDLILVRKIGAPGAPEVALGAIVDGANPQTVINEEVRRRSGADDIFLERARARELAELERRRAVYLGGRSQVSPAGHSAIIVDDGLATGATMKAAMIAMRRQGAEKVCVAIPVAPADALEDISAQADLVVCLHPAGVFHGVGAFYDDFHQLTDEETVGLLRQSWAESRDIPPEAGPVRRQVSVPPLGLPGDLCVPPGPRGVVLFALGSGSSRLSPRNIAVAEALNAQGFATLLFDLLTPAEAHDRRNVFDIALLAERVVEATLYLSGEPEVADLPQDHETPAAAKMLLDIRGIGPEVAAVLWSERLFRRFDNRRQVAAYAGLAPTPWQSGAVRREQGVSKAGNPRLRSTMIQLAWLWLGHQPDSALTRRFRARVEQNGGRQRKTAIVALARKLLVALWKYVKSGVVIEGATMKPQAA